MFFITKTLNYICHWEWNWLVFKKNLNLKNVIGWTNTLILIPVKERMLSIALKNVLFKIMNNSVYGKTTENLRKRVQVRLVDNVKEYKNDPVEKMAK